MPTLVSIGEFIELAKEHPVIDVRSPKEFEQGHFPGAFSIPLMDNVERAVVGTMYKQNGKQAAILKGLEIAGPKLKEYIKQARKLPHKNVFLVHCWRGGMRSGFLSWLLEFYGFKVYILKGGYKSFRKRINDEFSFPRKLLILAGRTGSGKTEILKELGKKGEQIIDLEGLAHHKGSSFGALGEAPQPSQEMFENRLGLQLMQTDPQTDLWLEDESRTIGNKVIPEELWNQINLAKAIYLELDFDTRLDYITQIYGKYSLEELMESTERIRKRLGNEQCDAALNALKERDLKAGFFYSLKYYDKTYDHNLKKREPENIIRFEFSTFDPVQITETLLNRK